MPNCSKCSKSQAKLNKGALCKSCFQKKINKIMDTSAAIVREDEIHERNIIDLIKENMSQEKMLSSEIINILKDQIEHLKTDIIYKNTLIESLMTELYNRNNAEIKSSTIIDEHFSNHHKENPLMEKRDNYNEWQQSTKPSAVTSTQDNNWNIPLGNRYNGLPLEDCVMVDDVIDSDFQKNIVSNGETINKSTNIQNLNKGKVFVNELHANDLPLRNVATKLKNSNQQYSRAHRKILILSASITKLINMAMFNNKLINGNAVKRAHGGATTSRLKHYVKGDLEIDNPDTVIINGGTNNLTKTNQSVEEITEEILDIVDICRKHGVKNILVSSITCRPEFQWKIDDINNLLQDNSVRYNYVFIDNGNINENHLKRDQLHLNHQGTILLTNNFLFHLNRPCVTYPFASIWD